ncbi:MAG: zinc ribbon domain-containing protein [Candidatus Gracilibacteria bacterium]|jgi:putative FmdB family regulatory protein|nr:zinc ribbon domain-containing protein [Candidatus Gracilibacteria bacterium]
MPTFDFKCEKCGKTFSNLVNAGVTEVNCKCGSKAKKIFSVPNIQFKGKGFFASDHKCSGNCCKKEGD